MTTSRCPGCRARVRDADAWCSLCHTPLRAQAPAGPAGSLPDGPMAGPVAGPVTGPVRGPVTVDGLVGGSVPPEVLDRLEAHLRGHAVPRSGLRAQLEGHQQAVLAAAGVAVVLVVLLTGMTLAGLLL